MICIFLLIPYLVCIALTIIEILTGFTDTTWRSTIAGILLYLLPASATLVLVLFNRDTIKDIQSGKTIGEGRFITTIILMLPVVLIGIVNLIIAVSLVAEYITGIIAQRA